MRPTHLNGKGTTSSPLRIHKDSHFIRKSQLSPPPSSASATSSAAKPPHRQPVIIYTHSPKIIHTHPRDFKALVQKLTGQSPSDSDSDHPPKEEPPPEQNKNHRRESEATSEDTDSSSVVTDENCSSTVVRNMRIKSCFPPPPRTTMTTAAFYDPPPINPCFSHLNTPFFSDKSSDLLPFFLMNNF